jgi:hypothetical protein
VLLEGLGWLAVRARLLRGTNGLPSRGAYSGRPRWLGPSLPAHQEFGALFRGSRGLVEDAFKSLIESTSTDSGITGIKRPSSFDVVAATFGVFAIILYGSYRRRGALAVLPGVSLLALLGMISSAVVIERLIFHTPYPLGRTALFYIPLYVLLATFCCDALAEWGRFGKVAVACVWRRCSWPPSITSGPRPT